eukprot:78600-Amphidinium_carterae.1
MVQAAKELGAGDVAILCAKLYSEERAVLFGGQESGPMAIRGTILPGCSCAVTGTPNEVVRTAVQTTAGIMQHLEELRIGTKPLQNTGYGVARGGNL